MYVIMLTWLTTCLYTGLLFCVDGIPAFSANTKSLKPAELVNLSLPPSMRGRPEFMLPLMFLPATLKYREQNKYYNWAAKYELNDLLNTGIMRPVFI